jgi:hypothetical protein
MKYKLDSTLDENFNHKDPVKVLPTRLHQYCFEAAIF